VYIDEKVQHILASTMPLIIDFFYQNKKTIWKILRTDKINNFKFTIKFLMTLDRSYIGYLGFLGIDLFKSVLMFFNGAIVLVSGSRVSALMVKSRCRLSPTFSIVGAWL
jgi:hypothetical protein